MSRPPVGWKALADAQADQVHYVTDERDELRARIRNALALIRDGADLAAVTAALNGGRA